MSSEFDVALRGGHCTLLTNDGTVRPLSGHRWSAAPDAADEYLLRACRGPTLDIGCGPGRLTAALTGSGVIALGIDTSPLAVHLTISRRAVALCRDVFRPVPGAGNWREALLIDGNIGIGGDPRALLRRVHQLLRPGGHAWVEVEPPGTGLWRGTGQVVHIDRPGPSFRWAIVGADAIGPLAVAAGFELHEIAEHDGRWFAVLESARMTRAERTAVRAEQAHDR
ncbi:class I SAM-dependent methyltransferase [Saccharopolyspora sp. K220]|uniref:class I SAM-dependent methyltransferase n=1 Tax=Saccharopolyspora soli TaxID=2926618 RepID=UPI001F5A9A22|nr:class I SAM-dependent methyltransferase [Saccharopolyspora soli]MCI2422664.1 class I SAM-dependent methyltransferase [Saccharopolyspora soli]